MTELALGLGVSRPPCALGKPPRGLRFRLPGTPPRRNGADGRKIAEDIIPII